MTKYSGRWQLVASGNTTSEIDAVDPRFEAEFAYLSVSAIDLVETAQATSGLVLEVTDKRTFKQRFCGQPSVEWYDVEGVLCRPIVPFDGICHNQEAEVRLYLLPYKQPSWAISKDEVKRTFFRYDDEDTVICDFIEVRDGDLARTVNVLTDRCYLSHILMMFTRG